MPSIAVFCGAREGRDPRYAAEATALGAALAARGWTLVYGGGKVGLMGLLAQACLDGGGEVTGVIPGFLSSREVLHPGLQISHQVEDLFERKALMIELADAFVALPGGIGTVPQLENPAMLAFLRAQAARAEIVMSVCSGSALLAKAGLLDGRRATSNKHFFSLATAQSDKVDWVTHARWVEDDRFVTSSGVSAGIDMALAVIARLYGRGHAEQVARMTEYEWQADAGRDPFSQYLNEGRMDEYLVAIGRA